jgi:hypothetical protein
MTIEKPGERRHPSAIDMQDRLNRIHSDLRRTLRDHGIDSLELTGMTFSSSAALASMAATGWVWRCEMTPSGVVCHWVLA